MATQTYTIPNHLHGDTFKGLSFQVNVNSAPKNLVSTLITIEFRLAKKTGNLKKRLTIGQGITVTNAAGGVFQINPFLADLPVGIYYYDIQFNDAGVISTYVEGTWEIVQDVTQL
jgi:hypothetical protein